MRAIFQEHAPLEDLRVFGRMIGERNLPDFVSCMKGRRMEFAVAGNARLALEAHREGVFAIRGPEAIRVQLRTRLQAITVGR